MYCHKNRCEFRKLEEYDLWELYDLKMESWPTTHKTAIITEREQSEWFASIPKDSLYMVCSFEEPVGMTHSLGLLTLNQIDPIARTALIGGSIFHAYRGTEWSKKAWEAGTDFAFEMLNLHRLDAEVVEYNIAAFRMDLEIGYICEGRKRQSVYKCGRYYDSLVLGLLRKDWETSKRVVAMDNLCNVNFRRPTKDLASRILDRMKPPLQKSSSIGQGK